MKPVFDGFFDGLGICFGLIIIILGILYGIGALASCAGCIGG